MRAALAYDWPGNVRELRSAIEQALLLSDGAEIDAADLPRPPSGPTSAALAVFPASPGEPLPTFRDAKDRLVRQFEREFLLDALRRNGGNITRAAEAVGMYRQSFQQKMRELDTPTSVLRRGLACAQRTVKRSLLGFVPFLLAVLLGLLVLTTGACLCARQNVVPAVGLRQAASTIGQREAPRYGNYNNAEFESLERYLAVQLNPGHNEEPYIYFTGHRM